MQTRKIGIFFGSFNPIHNGHLMVANDIKNKCGLDLIIFSLTPKNPLKEYKNILDNVSYSDKLNMLKIATLGIDYFQVSDVETTLPSPNYTYQSLDKYAKMYPNDKIYLIIGEDEFEVLNKWKKYEYILSTYSIIVASRVNKEDKLPLKYYAKYQKNITFVDSLNVNISSSIIREYIRNKNKIDFYLPNDVVRYIETRSLYKENEDENILNQTLVYPKVPSSLSLYHKKSNEAVYNEIKEKLIFYFNLYKIKSVTIGLSGGLDSSVNAYIFYDVCKELGIKLNGRFIIVGNYNEDEMKRAKAFGLLYCNSFSIDDITDMYELYLSNHENQNYTETDFEKKIRRGNIKVRLRMIHLYDINQQNKGVVSDNDNKTERELGFWTLNGDVGDVTPLASLYKTEVFSLAVYIYNEKCKSTNEKKAFKDVIEAIPTDGLGITSSDLEQIGAKSYHDVDDILFTYELNNLVNYEILPSSNSKYGEEVTKNVLDRHIKSDFKRNHPYRIKIY